MLAARWADDIRMQAFALNRRPSQKELDQKQPEAWAKKSYEVAVKIAYENGNLRGTPKGQVRDCRDVPDTNFISRGYPAKAKLLADRRVYLAGYRIAELLGGREQINRHSLPRIKSDTSIESNCDSSESPKLLRISVSIAFGMWHIHCRAKLIAD